MKPDPNKLQDIVDIKIPTTMTEAQTLIGVVQYYMYMWSRCSHKLVSLTEAARVPKYRAILWNYDLEVAFRELKRMVSE